MTSLRYGAALGVSLSFMGCPDKKPAPMAVKPAESKTAPAVVTAPVVPPEPRASKECAAPIDPGPTSELRLGSRTAQRTGARLTFSDKDVDGALVLGVLGPINEDSGLNLLALRKYVKFFQDEKADAIVVTGDVGEVASGINRVLSELAASSLPVLVIIGNRECRAEYTDGVLAAQAKASNIVNMNEVRVVEFPELTLVSLPGYHDPNYINCKTGCQYVKSTVAEVVSTAKEATTPVMLVAHGPPHGEGPQSLDFAGAGGNVGDPAIPQALIDGHIAFGVFSNIKEAGGRASKDPSGAQLVKEGESAAALYLNPGPADTMGWDMNDSTKSVGMAATVTIKNGQGSYKLLRLKPPTAAEKAEAKKLDPREKTE